MHDPASRPLASAKIWDLGVRIFHWLLVIAVAAAALTGFFARRRALDIHLIAGSAIAALILFRIVWGVVGNSYARFGSFAFSPAAILAYARELRAGRAGRFLGHNPLGGAMVFALLLVLAAIVASGTIGLGGLDKQGPLAAFTSFAAGSAMMGPHQALAWLLLAMIAAHLAGVVYESRRERENLALAMVTGVKQAEPGTPPAAPGNRRLATIASAALLVVVGGPVVALSFLPGKGVPPATMDADYARECGACHMAYPPSILPAAAGHWIITHLDRHFGEDASLSPQLAAHIGAYMAANSAEHWDTLAAVRLRSSVNPKDPLRITATGFWQRMHHWIPEAVFANRRIAGRGSCNACHEDAATGLFAPQSIEIPDDLQ